MTPHKRVLFVVGPTGTGKTALSLALAEKCYGEIISADSMQVYAGLDIGTDKISLEDRVRIPHYGIDIRRPDEEYSAYDFRTDALQYIHDIISRKRLPIVAGGSGLYIKALVDGLDEVPGSQYSMRSQLELMVREKGLAYAYEEATKKDPERAKKIHPHDARRIIRLLEMNEGKTGEKLQKNPSLHDLGYSCLLLGLMRERQALYQAVEERVDRMMARGLEEEVRRVMAHPSRTTRQAVGYKELMAFMRGECTRDEAVLTIKKNTRHLVKKQCTWFRQDERIQWIAVDGKSTNELVAEAETHIKWWLQH